MKLTVALLITASLLANAEGRAQKVTLSLKNASLEQVFNQVKSQTGFSFIWDESMLKRSRPVDINVKNVSIPEVMDYCLKGQSLAYQIIGEIIVIKQDAEIARPVENIVKAIPPPIEIHGRITNVQGEPLQNVSVFIVGAHIGTTTNIDGRFTLPAPDDRNVILEVSSVGYQTREVNIGKRTEVNIVLELAVSDLSDVVVVGYGTERRKDLTGSIATVSSQEVEGRKTVQVSDALQGAIGGIAVTRSSGAPGESSVIRFRGITTIGNNDPLVIVDGIPVASIDDLNPGDIKSISALKDAASASIYGSRAAAGVLLITTHRGQSGEARLEYNYQFGSQMPTQLPEYVGATRYMQLNNEYLTNDGSAPAFTEEYINAYLQNNAQSPDVYPITDWQAVLLKNSAPRHVHNLSFSVGSEKVKTRASLGYSDIQGLYKNLSFERFTLQINNDFKITDKLSASMDVAAMRNDNRKTIVTNGDNPLFIARLFPPILYDDVYSDGRFAPGKDGLNPLAQILNGGFDRTYNNLIRGRLLVNFKPFRGFTLTAITAPSFRFSRQTIFSKRIGFTSLDDPSLVVNYNQSNTTLNESRPYSYTFNAQLLADYATTIAAKHNIGILAGYEENYGYDEYLTAYRGAFSVVNYPYLDNGSLALRGNTGGAAERSLRSFFGRLRYNFDNRYYLQANLRIDGSSRFGADNRWALFPSFSGGWAVSEEGFFKSGRISETMSLFKIRGSWGQTGNERIGDYPYQASIIFQNALLYADNNVTSFTSGGQETYAVPDISWETQQTSNIGVDLGFFNNRLLVTGDYFTKRTTDILIALDIPVYLGLQKPFQNAGKVSSKGWELASIWSDKAGNIKYSVGLNISDAKTHIDDLKGTQQLADLANIQGGEFESWYGYRSAGLFQTQDEVSNSPVLNVNARPGDIRYVDIDGDGNITPDKDKVLLSGSLPRYIYGFSGSLQYKNFDFFLSVQGVGKQNSRLSFVQVQPLVNAYGSIPKMIDGNFWSASKSVEQNASAMYPRLSRLSDLNNYQMSDFWLINGSYMRVKNITIGYTLPSSALRAAGIRNARIYIAANDAFTISEFPIGWDPEMGSSTSYPIITTVMGGINIQF